MNDFQIYVTEQGKAAGWVSMHVGGYCRNPESRFLPWGEYTPATMEELDAAVASGDLCKEYGHWVHIGGILRDWVPAA